MRTIRHYDENKEIQNQYYQTLQKIKDEELLDWMVKQQLGPNRPALEALALKWSAPLGWQFTASITQRQTTPDHYDMLLPYEALPSAGKDLSETADGTLFEIIPGGKFTTQYSRKTILQATRCCSYQELLDFTYYFLALQESNLIPLSLEPAWALCSCGHPVKTEGYHIEDGFCPVCDKPIENFIYLGDYYEESIKSPDGYFNSEAEEEA